MLVNLPASSLFVEIVTWYLWKALPLHWKNATWPWCDVVLCWHVTNDVSSDQRNHQFSRWETAMCSCASLACCFMLTCDMWLIMHPQFSRWETATYALVIFATFPCAPVLLWQGGLVIEEIICMICDTWVREHVWIFAPLARWPFRSFKKIQSWI